MTKQRVFRGKHDDRLYRGIRYGEDDGTWSKECIPRIVGFIIGYDPNKNVTALNERMLDVVTPIYRNFDPVHGVADIQIFDPKTEIHHQVKLGTWIMKSPDETLSYIQPEHLADNFEEIIPKTVDTSEFDELVAFINDDCESVDRNVLASVLATKLLRAGWTRKG